MRTDEIRGFIVENFLYGQDDGSLGDDVSFLEKGIIDSTGVLELVSFIEERYGISVSDDELIPDNFDSLNKLSSFVSRKTGNGKKMVCLLPLFFYFFSCLMLAGKIV